MRFADVPGHEAEKQRLRDMADNGRIPHALLFEGRSGSGKFMLARAFASYIHCTDRTPDGDSCGRCAACRQMDEFSHIDTLYSFPVVKKKNSALSDDYAAEFREFLSESPFMDLERWLVKLDKINSQPQIYVEEGNELLRRLTFMTRRSRYKTVLMWLPERMKEETANKLLKLVEEPFSDTIFLMVSNDSRLILPTIYSRTQRINIPRYSDNELCEILIEKGFEEAAVADVARQAEGNVNLALKLINESEEHKKFFNLFVELMRKSYGRKVSELREWSVEAASLGREGCMRFIDYSTRLVRESFVSHLNVDELLTMSRTERDFISKFSPFINERNVEDIIKLMDTARRDIAANVNSKIVFFNVAIRIIMLLRR